jgi:putative ABC transport system permease protein
MGREDDLSEELQAHIDIESKRLMDEGLSYEAAIAEARRTFGSRAYVAERTREEWGWAWLRGVWQDLRYATRAATRSPGFSFAAVLSLALGIGAATVVFSVADTVYLRPLPYRAPEELVFLGVRMPIMPTEFLPDPDLVAWRRDNTVFEGLAATQFNGSNPATLGSSDPIEVRIARISSNFLDTFGVTPALGRGFHRDEEFPNEPRAVMLTHSLWRNHFRGARDVIGRSIVVDGDCTVVGVLPPSFVMPMNVRADILQPIAVAPNASHHDRNLSIFSGFARLKHGVTLAQAKANLDALLAASRADAPQMFRDDSRAVIEPLQERMVGNARTLVLVLAGAVACLLLIACANVANLLLARWSARTRELAVRAAIGAGRARLVRQLVTETAMLAAAGLALAIGLVLAGLRGFVYLAGNTIPRLNEVRADARVFGIALAVSLLTVVLFGVMPALRAGCVDIQTVLQQAARQGMTGGYRIARRVLVAAEVALSVVLLCGAALLLQTLWRMQHDRLGFAPEHVMHVSILTRGARTQPADRHAFIDDMLSEMRRIPGTEAASWNYCTPLSTGGSSTYFTRSDRPLPKAFDRTNTVSTCGVGPDYFAATGVSLIRGRVFGEADYDHQNTVAVINETLARQYFPGEDPIGRQIGGRPDARWKTVIGIVADTRNAGLGQATIPQVYYNAWGSPAGADLGFVARHVTSESVFTSAVRAKLRTTYSGMLAAFETMDDTIARMSAGQRFNGVLVGSFAAIAFLMAVVGVYGVLAFAVTQRTQEIGIRIALGAGPQKVQIMVLREGAALVGIGAAAGLGGALTASRYLGSLLYGVTATDVPTYVAVIVGIGVAAMVSAWAPARRAASVDPAVVLRGDV